MATSYQLLNEQIRRLYSRGADREDLSPRLDSREIKLLLVQEINSLIKAEIANIGEIPDTVIGTYTVTPAESSCIWQADMPAFPVNLPKNQGIHRVYPDGCPWKPYVPIKSGDFDIAQGTPTQYLEGLIGYYQEGKKICFTKEPSQTVTLKLIVNDPANITDSEILPIPVDMESVVIEAVLKKLTLGQASQYELNSKQEATTPKQNDSN